MTKAEKVNSLYDSLKVMYEECIHDEDTERAECTIQAICDTIKFIREITLDADKEEKSIDK
jgi:hypothetical protein